MARQFEALSAEHQRFIQTQHLFFTASASATGPVNLSPKGGDTLRILDARRVCYLDLTGSGAETAAHARHDGRLTLMFAGFGEESLILRLYGHATLWLPGTPAWATHAGLFPPLAGARAIIHLAIDTVQTSCGYAVPRYDYLGERDAYPRWAGKKGAEGLLEYVASRNDKSLEGLDTGLAEPARNALAALQSK